MSLSRFHHFIWNTVLLTEPFYHAHSSHSPLLLVSGPLYKCKLLQLFFMSVMASTFLGSSWSQTGAPKYCRKCFLLVYLGIHQKLNFRSIKLFGKADKLLCPASSKMSLNFLRFVCCCATNKKLIYTGKKMKVCLSKLASLPEIKMFFILHKPIFL